MALGQLILLYSFHLEGQKMQNNKQPASGDSADWPLRLAGMAGGVLGATIGLLSKPLVHLPLPWGAIAFVAVVAVGIVLGRLAGNFLSGSAGEPVRAQRHAQPRAPRRHKRAE